MLVQLVLLVICQTILADPLPKPYFDLEDYGTIGRHFEGFIKTYERNYNHHEKAMRFKVFVENLKNINSLNQKYKLATYDIGPFTDYTQAERRALFGFIADENLLGDCKPTQPPNTKDAPAAIDWRDKGFVTPIKDQKHCGSCWAFSATGMIESRVLQKGKAQIILSEQQMVDCDKKSAGCYGGLMSLGITALIQEGGQETNADYPYAGKDGQCQFKKDKVAVKIANCSGYSFSSEEPLKELLYQVGPLSIAVDAVAMVDYKSGILEDCGEDVLNHGMVLVAYGTEGGTDFWAIKNSWGEKYGENGYIRIKRGVKCCGIANPANYATISAEIA